MEALLMEHCSVCAEAKDTSDLLPTCIITKREQTKNIHICRTCVNYVCDTQIGEWFPLKSTDEMVRLPNSFYMRL